MKVVHLSNTPVAGSPGNIVSALNRLTEVRARHIVFNAAAYRTRTFAVDIDWQTQQQQAIDAIADADVIHIHQFFSLDDTFGAGFAARLRDKKIIRQYHSAPDLWANGDARLIERIVREDVPQLVIAQGPERYYPFARVVPNVVPLNDPRYMPHAEAQGTPIVTFSPSGRASAWKRRLGNEGRAANAQVAAQARTRGALPAAADCRYAARRLFAREAASCCRDRRMRDRKLSLERLEALSQGKPTLGHLDNRVQSQLRKLTGASDLPWIDVRLEEAEAPLRALLEDRALRAQLGAASRQWMETHYQESAMIEHYRRAYIDLFDAPHRFGVQRLSRASGSHGWRSRCPTTDGRRAGASTRA